MESDPFDLESLTNLEQSFHDTGCAEGFEHGRIHGLIEGRALGREKGFEMWEEVGFYLGFAELWKAVYMGRDSTSSSRASIHIKNILDLIAQFPTENPSAGSSVPEVDISSMLTQIRSKYKALCATLGIRPRLFVAGSVITQDNSEQQAGTQSLAF